MFRLAMVLLLAGAVGANAEDARLKELRELLVPMRTDKLKYPRPEFTTAKHVLRDWIESRLGPGRGLDAARLAKELNDELIRAKLSWATASNDDTDAFWSSVGYLGEVRVEYQLYFLVVRTGVGIQCGFDESAYAYRYKDGRWQRYWQSEQNDYREGKYSPQRLEAVLVSRDWPKGADADQSEHLILTLGRQSWCMSSWHSVYYRAWQTGDRYPDPKLLLDQSELAYVAEDPAIAGEVDPDEVLVEYVVNNYLPPGPVRPEVRHYKVKNGKIARVDPVVLGPRNFVAEWLDHPWSESSLWTEPAHRAILATHRQEGESNQPTLHCKQPDLWQVSADLSKELDGSVARYFLVRWRPPFHFTMVDVSDEPWPGCTEEDREADEWRTMFRPPGWQWERDSN